LYIVHGRRRRLWYAKWRQGQRQVKRCLGLVREPGTQLGLTRSQAEALLRRELAESARAPSVAAERLTLMEADERYIQHVEHFRARKHATVRSYRSVLRTHLGVFFAGRSLDAIDRRSVVAYQHAKLAEGLSPKTVSNHVRFLHGIYRHAVGQEWTERNPVAGIEHPGDRNGTYELRALSVEELEAVIRAVPDDHLGPLDRLLYLTAAMTGMRRGELQALRWMDVDWHAGVIRVRRSFSFGEFTTPKSQRSVRAVPMAERVAMDLACHQLNSPWSANEDPVFAHPWTGGPYDGQKILKRFKRALAVAGLRDGRFHDLRHTFGARMAAAGAPLRYIQEWMGHRDYKTTTIYADYAPDPSQGAHYAAVAFQPDTSLGSVEDSEHGGSAPRFDSTDHHSSSPSDGDPILGPS
jgi:integrase